MTERGPHSNDPTGADKPFDRQNITVSAGAHNSEGDVPSAIDAFQIRAPSTWTARSFSRATAATDATSSADQGRPDSAMYVFSNAHTEIAGPYSVPVIARRTVPALHTPPSSASGCTCMPTFHAAPASSYR